MTVELEVILNFYMNFKGMIHFDVPFMNTCIFILINEKGYK